MGKRFWSKVTLPIFVGSLVVSLPNSSNGQAQTGECRCVAEQGTYSVEITPLSSPQSVVDFYDYGAVPASSNTGLEVSNQSRLFLYENSLTGDISLVVNHDKPNDGGGGTANFTFSGLPLSSFISVSDDVPDSYFISPPIATANWLWLKCCTDGVAISRIGCDFEIDIIPSFGFNDGGMITSFVLLSRDVSYPDTFSLPSLSDTVTIRCTYLVGVDELLPGINPTRFYLYQNNPNPFNKLTAISYQLRTPSHTTLKVYDITGRLVETLVDEWQTPGVYEIRWNSRTPESGVRSGIYFYRLSAGNETSTRKLILLR
jgi:hypothetical protein